MNPKPILDTATLYIGDNGRIVCGKQACAGCHAFYTGRDLSGQPLLIIGDVEAEALRGAGCSAECEVCGHQHGSDTESAPRPEPEPAEVFTFTLY